MNITCKLSSIGLSFVSLCVWGAEAGAADHPEILRLSQVERHFADLLDAHGAVEAIRAGAVVDVDGRSLSDWARTEVVERDIVVNNINKLQYKPLNVDEIRVLHAMRRGVDEILADEPAASSARVGCSDALTTTLGAESLGAALYDCFDSVGNRIDFEGSRMTRVAAFQLLQEVDDPVRRKALFYAMSPLWTAINANNEVESPYRRLLRGTSKKFERSESPLLAAARSLGVSGGDAERWLIEVLEAWRLANRSDGPPIEPWDYRYHYAAASRRLSAVIPKPALLPLQRRFYRDLGADPDYFGVVFDIEPRAGKAPLAYSDVIRIGRFLNGRWRPAISRVSANDDRGGLGVLNELVHETGHAVHFIAIRTRPAYFWPDIAFIEAFADVPSWSVYSPEWQQRYLGVAATRAEGLREQYAGVMLDVAWSLFEIRMLRDPAADPNLLWTAITRQYFNIAPHPEIAWWAVRSQLVTDPGYMVNYGLGAFLTADIRARTRRSIGAFDAGNTRWYRWTSQRLLRFGGSVEMPELLRRFLGQPVSPAALIDEIAALGASQPRGSGGVR